MPNRKLITLLKVVKDLRSHQLQRFSGIQRYYRVPTHSKWSKCLNLFPPFVRSYEEQEWAATELRNALRSIEWDLEDLDDTVQIVERNPTKFRISASELALRKGFIAQTREEVDAMKAKAAGQAANEDVSVHREVESIKGHVKNLLSFVFQSSLQPVPLGSPSTGTTPGQRQQSGGYSRVAVADVDEEEEAEGGDGSNGMGNSSSSANLLRQQQAALLRDQDGQLGAMSESVGAVRDISRDIGGELDEQAVMLDEFGAEIEQAETKLDATMRKMSKVLHMSNGKKKIRVRFFLWRITVVLIFMLFLVPDRRQWMAIGVLSSTAVIILMIIFAL